MAFIVIFTAADDECVKVWDLRARAVVCDLSTGNNSVRALGWDARRSTLYAATQCEYNLVDWRGQSDYRLAELPEPAEPLPSTGTSEHDGGDDDNDDEDEENWMDEDDFGPPDKPLARTKFGSEDTHVCFIGKEPCE